MPKQNEDSRPPSQPRPEYWEYELLQAGIDALEKSFHPRVGGSPRVWEDIQRAHYNLRERLLCIEADYQ